LLLRGGGDDDDRIVDMIDFWFFLHSVLARYLG